jgi:hypothetical protein
VELQRTARLPGIEDALPAPAHLHPAVDLHRRRGLPGRQDHLADEVGGLQQRVRHEGAVAPEGARSGLEADQIRVAGGERVGVGVPPALVAGGGGQLPEEGGVGVGDGVERQQPVEVVGRDADAAGLDARHLRRGPPQPLGDVLAVQRCGGAQPPELAGQASFARRGGLHDHGRTLRQPCNLANPLSEAPCRCHRSRIDRTARWQEGPIP